MTVDLDAARRLMAEIYSLHQRLDNGGLWRAARAMDNVEKIGAIEIEAAIVKADALKRGRGADL